MLRGAGGGVILRGMSENATRMIVAADLPQARLDALARDLARDLGRVGVRATAEEAKAGPGERGVLTAIGQFIVDGLGGKVAAGVLDLLKAYISREKSFAVTINRPDGTRIEISSKNVGSREVAAFLGLARDAAG